MVAELNIYNIKKLGQVSTPDNIVDFMLDAIGYKGESILNKHILDNSCGEGAFLKGVVKRYIETAKEKNLSQKEIKKGLETYIHGVEIDHSAYENCLKSLNFIFPANYDLKLGDALFIREYNKKMDFVVGNPPYVKIHNLNGEYKNVISQKQLKGMVNLYLLFYFLSFQQLNATGKLIYITPSFFKNASSKILREKIYQEKKLVHIYNFKHQQVFPDITTYPVIALFANSQASQKFNYSAVELNNNGKEEVKNAFATLADDVFIADKFSFRSPDIIKIVKSSTGEIKECIFPYYYDEKSKRHLLKDFAELDENTRNYLLAFQSQLEASQAINDVGKNKIYVNCLFNKEVSNVNFGSVPEGMGIYGGIYILPNGTKPKIIENNLESEKFKDFNKASKEVIIMKPKLDNLNEKFLKCLEQSFLKYLEKGSKGVRGTGKLKILHPHIARDLGNVLGAKYQIFSLDEKQGKEKIIRGRYMEKRMDIAVMKGEKPVAGLGIKFIMSNYRQNSNNYFENMLGETANIRTNSILYFQIVICFARSPYFHKEENKEKVIKNFERVSLSHLEKYQILSQDDTTIYLHSPLKTLLMLVDFANIDCEELFKNNKLKTNSEFIQTVKEKGAELKFSELEDKQQILDSKVFFKDALIFNDYQKFIKKCAYLIEGFFGK
ncbi:11069_t:CDS:2 [Racocetra fulgida]|uniref:site-specific DNA-methyltransferase (adenine-specific) n=1 Tax=Racocetra fulgida TaxID=60492 RepID=A0A9N8VGN6_9GLOM|nr:11069_t:CDS:2 [Racocetra fulgida]